ncbi:MAG: M23 family metallopeptidase [Elusimicrobia bacterium]|nr:M23 family metallopeptidase [Elusimicrobiota bacterium]
MRGGKKAAVAVELALGAFVLAVATRASPAVAPYDWSRYSVMTPAGPDEPSPEVFRTLHRVVWTEHKIVRGEQSAFTIAKKYGTTTASLQATNNDELYILGVGRKLTVYNRVGQLYEVKKDSETFERVAARFCREGDKRRRQACEEGIVLANRLPGSLLVNEYEFPRGSRILITKFAVPNFDTYHLPITGSYRISSGFGSRYHPILKRKRMHDGYDMAKPYGSPVYAAKSGVVVDAGWVEGYGQLITIRHVDGWTTRYGHLSKILVKPGQKVNRGTLIGKVGSTGLSTGPHLHFEVRNKDGKAVNPGAKIGRR